ncbi:MAG: hypothetical protein AAGL17_04370 [Cyanobacteria bacterium J06576_12]
MSAYDPKKQPGFKTSLDKTRLAENKTQSPKKTLNEERELERPIALDVSIFPVQKYSIRQEQETVRSTEQSRQ